MPALSDISNEGGRSRAHSQCPGPLREILAPSAWNAIWLGRWDGLGPSQTDGLVPEPSLLPLTVRVCEVSREVRTPAVWGLGANEIQIRYSPQGVTAAQRLAWGSQSRVSEEGRNISSSLEAFAGPEWSYHSVRTRGFSAVCVASVNGVLMTHMLYTYGDL